MVKKKVNLLMFLCLVVLLTFQGATLANANQKEFILSHIMPQDHFFHEVSMVFIDKLDSLSGGAMKVRYHLGGDLGDWVTQFDQAMRGIIPMTMVWNLSELDPRLDLSILGFVADDWESAKMVFGPGGLLEETYRDILKDLNLMMVGTVPNGFAGFVVRRGVDVPKKFPEDARGFKMRIPQFVMGIKRYEALGFSPVTIPFSELHTALQTGTVDGRAYGPAGEQPMFADVLDAFVYTKEHLDHVFFVVSKSWFDKLSDKEKEWVWEAGVYASEWAWANIEADEEAKIEECKEKGIEIVMLSPEQQKQYKEIVRNAEWPLFEEITSKKLMDQVREAASKVDEK